MDANYFLFFSSWLCVLQSFPREDHCFYIFKPAALTFTNLPTNKQHCLYHSFHLSISDQQRPVENPSIALFQAAPDAHHREPEHQQSPSLTGDKQVLLPDATDTSRRSHPLPILLDTQSCQYPLENAFKKALLMYFQCT